MSESVDRIISIFKYLETVHREEKLRYLNCFLSYFTIAGRGIDSSDNTDSEKYEAYKWLNELTHRMWNIKYELEQGQDIEIIDRIYENIKFYADYSKLLSSHLIPTILASFDKFNATKEKSA